MGVWRLPSRGFGQTGLSPKLQSHFLRVDAHLLPPRAFVAGAVRRTVMSPAQRHGEFVADFAAKGAALRETQMMRIRGQAPAYQAGLRGHEPHVIFVPDPAWLRKGQSTLVDCDTFGLDSMVGARTGGRKDFTGLR